MNKLKAQQGFALVATYMLMAVVTIGAAASFTRSYVYTREAEKQKNSIVALEMAEGAIDQAIVQLGLSTSYSGTSGYQDFSSGSAQGGYAISVTTPTGASSDIRQIGVTGYAPGNTSTSIGYKTTSVNVYTQFPNTSYFTKALFANTSYSNVGNGTTDSYDSDVAAYYAATAGSNGDVGTNSTAGGAVDLTGNAIIKGDVVVGPGGNPLTVVTNTGSATITGTTSAQTTATTLPTPSTSIGSSGAMAIAGNNTLNLASGTYHYSSISISGNGSLTTTGEVTIYVSGSISISGNGASAYGSLPKNLKIYVTGTSNVSVSGNGSTYAAIYAPRSAVSISGNGSVYGAVVGDTISMNGNASFHYDEALGRLGGTSAGDPTVLSYMQTGNGSWTN